MMNNSPRITRRAALVGALASSAALALPAAATVARPATLEALADRFRDEAMALDPAISRCWLGYDELMRGPRENRVMSLYFERETSPIIRTRSDPISPLPGLIDAHKSTVRRHTKLARLDGELCAVNGNTSPDMLAKLKAACDAEEAARLALVLYRPRTSWEAKRKATYIGRSMPFREGWCDDAGFVAAIIASMGRVS